MRDIVALVFGGEPAEPHDVCGPHEHPCGGRAARAVEWCQTEPGDDALTWLGRTLQDTDERRGGKRKPWRIF